VGNSEGYCLDLHLKSNTTRSPKFYFNWKTLALITNSVMVDSTDSTPLTLKSPMIACTSAIHFTALQPGIHYNNTFPFPSLSSVKGKIKPNKAVMNILHNHNVGYN